MLAQALSRRFADRGIHYGWAIVAVTFLVSLVTAGAMGLPGALILPLSREFGWNTEQISGALARAHPAVRADGAVRRGADRALRLEARHPERTGDDLQRPVAGTGDDPDLASLPALGNRRRPRHRHDRAGDVGDRRHPLVHRAARPRARHADGEQRDGATGVSPLAAWLESHWGWRVGAGALADRNGPRRRSGVAVHGRSARRRRAATVRRDRQDGAACPPSGRRSPARSEPCPKSPAILCSGSWPARSSSAA